MKKLMKILALSLSLALCLSAFVSCGLIKDTDEVEKAKLKNETVLKIGDDIEVTGAYYGYYFSSVKNEMLQQNQAASADSSAQSSAEPKELDLKEVKEKTQQKIIATKMAYKKAEEKGIKLTSEDKKNISDSVSQIKSSVSQSGMSFKDFCTAMETTPEAIEEVITEEYYGNLYFADLVKDKYVSAKHILIEGADEAAKAEALKKIQEIEKKIKSGEDFDKLMNEKSEDPGLKTSPDGYTFTTGEMVEAFEKAAFALKEDEVSGIVETDYGYHIIKRIETKLSGIASALTKGQNGEVKDIIDAEKEKITKGIKATETDKISFYKV